jgi:NAD-dependent deacetylase
MASLSEALMVVGTSAVVSPANTIPAIAKERGSQIIEINLEPTHLTDTITDIFLQGKAGEVIMALLQEIKRAAKHTCTY